jgi:predicted nucleic acid-binding protein
MNVVFADSYYYLALLNRADQDHHRAVAFSRQYRAGQLTTVWVLTEVADALAAPRQRDRFPTFLAELRASPCATIVPPSLDLFDRAVALYRSRPDKAWSLTDCVSFVVMRERGMQDALTADHHFEQAGFRILF